MSEMWRYHPHGTGRAAIVTEAGYTIVDPLMLSEAKVIVAAHNAAVRRIEHAALIAADAEAHGGGLTDEGVCMLVAKAEAKAEAERLTYFVEATYRTPRGAMGRWSGRMASKSGDILADAERIVRKYRRVAGKLDIKATALR